MGEGIDDIGEEEQGLLRAVSLLSPVPPGEGESPWDGECSRFLIPCTAGSGESVPKCQHRVGTPEMCSQKGRAVLFRGKRRVCSREGTCSARGELELLREGTSGSVGLLGQVWCQKKQCLSW